MTDYRHILRYVFVLTAIILVIGFEVATARGGRGGGSRGGSRYRGSSYRGSSYRGSRSIAWKTSIIAGAYFGSRRYMTRRRYYSNQAPRICSNHNVGENGTVFGQFVCPLGDQPDDFDYCCGEERKQRCCRFADDPGRVAGMVVGILIFFAIIGLVIFCCCKYQKKKAKRQSVSHKPNFPLKPAGPPTAYPNGATAYPPVAGTGYPSTAGMAGAPTYPPAGVDAYLPAGADAYPPAGAPGYPPAGAPGYPPAGAPAYPPADAPYPGAVPPSYESATGLPYSTNPSGPPTEGLPYSPNPVGFVDPSTPSQAQSGAKATTGQPHPY